MGLNIKNERTHAKVRRLAELTGMSMTAAIDDAVERRLRELGIDPRAEQRAAREREVDRLVAAWREAAGPNWREDIERAEAELYDENGMLR